MELIDLELHRAAHWQQREGVATAGVGALLLAGLPLAPQEQRVALALARQEPLLYVGLSLLLNMAEDVVVERKMVKKVSGHPLSCRSFTQTCQARSLQGSSCALTVVAIMPAMRCRAW
jgi:hypothetical protein